MSCIFAKHVRHCNPIISDTSLIFATSREPEMHLSMIQAMCKVLHAIKRVSSTEIMIVDRMKQIIKSNLKKLKYEVDL